MLLGFELETLCMALYHLSHALSPLCFGYFSDTFLLREASDPDPPTYASHVDGLTGKCHPTWLAD
jgi:hypothetical protein